MLLFALLRAVGGWILPLSKVGCWCHPSRPRTIHARTTLSLCRRRPGRMCGIDFVLVDSWAVFP